MVFGVLDDRRPVVVSDHPLVLLLVRAPAWGHGMLVIAALMIEGVSKVSEKYRFFKHLRAKQPWAHVFWGAVPPYFACASACGSEVARPFFLRLPLIGVGKSEALIDVKNSKIIHPQFEQSIVLSISFLFYVTACSNNGFYQQQLRLPCPVLGRQEIQDTAARSQA